jgi:hypothetical protein
MALRRFSPASHLTASSAGPGGDPASRLVSTLRAGQGGRLLRCGVADGVFWQGADRFHLDRPGISKHKDEILGGHQEQSTILTKSNVSRIVWYVNAPRLRTGRDLNQQTGPSGEETLAGRIEGER